MSKKHFLLIGGAGFIGENLTRNLIEKKQKVLVLDRRETSLKSPFLETEIFDFYGNQDITPYLKGIDCVIFLICNVAPKTSMENPELSYGKNISKLIDLLEKMKKVKVKQMAFISSGGTVYGKGYNEPIDEMSSTNPINHYGILKLTQEKIILMYNQCFQMENVIFRVANPYGLGQRISSGVGAVTAFLSNMINDKDIYLYGNGTNIVRDYIYIDDVAEIISRYLLLEKKENRFFDKNAVYNIGTGKGHTLGEVLRTVEEVTKTRSNVTYLPERSVDVNYNVLSPLRIQSVIGKYQFKSLKEGITEYYNSIKEEINE